VFLLEFVLSVLGIASIATSAAIVICFWLWLRFCRHVYDQAVELDQKPDPQKMIKAASQSPLRRMGRRPRPPLAPKPKKPPDDSG
jgi:hypothetical protein